MEDQRAEELWYQYHMMVDGPDYFKQFDCQMKSKNDSSTVKPSEDISSYLAKMVENQNKNIALSLIAALSFYYGKTDEG